MIRVLQFGMSFNRGGIETFLFNYYKYMDHSKVQFDFVKACSQKIPYEDEIIAMGGRVYEFKACGIRKGYLQNRRQWLEFFEMVKPDVVHYNTTSLLSLYALKYAKKSNVQMLIAHAHPNTYSQGLTNIKMTILSKVNKYMVRLYADELWACSQEAGKWMFGKKFRVIPNAIDMERFRFDSQQRQQLREKMDLNERFVICNVGNLSNVKNQGFLIDIFAEIKKREPNSKLLLLGDGMLRKQLEEKVRDIGISNGIIFVGNVPDVENYLSASDLFVFPSKSEGFGIALLEAQANGLRCYTSADVVPEATNVTGGVTFLSLEKSPKYWAEQILRSLGQGRIPQESIEQLKDQYDVKRCAHNLQKMYLERFQ